VGSNPRNTCDFQAEVAWRKLPSDFSRGETKMKRTRGFTLVELLVTMAIALILLAIAIPNLVGARRSANETAAANNLRAVWQAQNVYQNTYGGYAPAVANLATKNTPPDCAGAGMLDATVWIGTPTLAGYNFSAITVPGADNPSDVSQTIGGCPVWHSWSMTATPLSTSTGTKGFYIDDAGTTKYSKDGTAPTPTSLAMGQ
jgi:prepilin-type N-terminal cleavage/methylation domain-containing protein